MLNGEQSTDRELLARSAAGDADAFEAFYARYETLIASYLARRVRSREDTIDLTVETFAQALVSASRYRDESGSSVGWLLGIATNLQRTAYRRGQLELRARARLRIERIDHSDESLERVDALLDDADPGNPLWVALERLPANQRQAIRSHILDDRSYADLAVELNITEATARQRVARGLSRLRSALEPSSQGDRP